MTIERSYLDNLGVIPVVVVEDISTAVPMAQALVRGGIKAIEITLRSDAAIDAIKEVKQACPSIEVGAGSVITLAQFDDVMASGSDFVVSPGLNKTLVSYASANKAKYLPGVATASELMDGVEMGLSCFKFFPAVLNGGIPYLKALAGPIPGISFCPTGGLTIDSFTEFLDLPNVACVGGTWLSPKGLVDNKSWSDIELIAKQTFSKI